MPPRFVQDGKTVKLSKKAARVAEQTTLSLRATYSERSMSAPFGVPDNFTVAQARRAGLEALQIRLEGSWKGDPPVMLDIDNVDIQPKPKGDNRLVRELGADPSFTYWPLGDDPTTDSPMAAQIAALRRQELHREEREGGSSSKHFLPPAPSPLDDSDVVDQVSLLAAKLKDMEATASVRDEEFGKVNDGLKDELRQAKEELTATTQARLRDRAMLHKFAKQMLLDDAREKVATLASKSSWQDLIGPLSTTQEVRNNVDSILTGAADLAPSLGARHAKLVEILVERNYMREDGNAAARDATRELTWEAIEALDEGSEQKALLSAIYSWLHGPMPA